MKISIKVAIQCQLGAVIIDGTSGGMRAYLQRTLSIQNLFNIFQNLQ